jgi:hypothetical protein
MGQTATCEVEIDGKPDRGQALLETTELIFRGRGKDQRVRVPFAAISKLAVEAGQLRITWKAPDKDKAKAKAARITLELGARAEVWAGKIKNPPSRLDKLGVKPGMKVAVWGALETEALDELTARAEVRVGKPRGGEALVFLAVETLAELQRRLPEAAAKMATDGAVWVVRRKGKDATVSEAASMAAGKSAGLVDTKVAAFSPTHTAERYVIPVAARGR